MPRRDRKPSEGEEERSAPAAPFVIGQWVRGERFFGRQPEIREILDGPRDCVWLLGSRRIGKTSLLKQLELLTAPPQRGFLPLYWNLQGADNLEELTFTFGETLLDAAPLLDGAEVDLVEHQREDLFATLGELRRSLRRRDLTLLLLCDEAEQLIRLGREDAALLQKLGRMMRSGDGIRCVLASTIRLWALAEKGDEVSGLLRALMPPLYLGALSDDEARSLVRQGNRSPPAAGRIDDQAVETIRERCGNHPYLLQLYSKRYVELGELEEAFEELATDPMVAAAFLSDLEGLAQPELKVLEALGEGDAAAGERLEEGVGLDASTVSDCCRRLESLGLLRGDETGYRLSSAFFRRWLRARSQEASELAAERARATEIVADLSHAGGSAAASPEELLGLVYDPLRELARGYLRRERPGHTLQPTALVHEAYLKLVDQTRVDWKGRSHFFAVGAKIMRRILIDHARSRGRVKRGGNRLQVTLTNLAAPARRGNLDMAQLLTLHDALEKLAAHDERQARVVELRFFAGLTMAEVAEVLGVSKRTVDTAWAHARSWLEREFSGSDELSS